MDQFLSPLLNGIGLLADPWLWLVIIAGTAYGMIAGATPGVGNLLAIAAVLPITFAMEPTSAVAFLLSISVGVQFANSIPAILIGIPGTPSAVLTVMDGFSLHKRGESGTALGVSFLAAVIGQIVSIPFFVLLVVPLAGLAYVMLAPELFAVYVLAMLAMASLTGTNPVKGLVAVAIGLLVGMVGLDPITTAERFTMGTTQLRGGIPTAPALIGILALSELFRGARQTFAWNALVAEFSARFPDRTIIRRTLGPIGVGSVLGTLMGAIPGAGAVPAAMVSYQQARFFSKHREEFGNGSIEGIAANESAQNSSSAGELIPTFGLGIPGSGSAALLLSALTFHGLVPGPLMTQHSPGVLHGAVAGLLGGSIVLVAVGWWVARLMLRLVTVDRSVVIAVATAATLIGVFAINSSIFDVFVALVFGIIGYVMTRYGYSTASAALAIIVATGFERQLRQGLALVGGDPINFLTRPVAGSILAFAVALFLVSILQSRRSRRATGA